MNNYYEDSDSQNRVGGEKMSGPGHKDDDPDKTKEEYDRDNHADQLNPNNDEYQGD